MTRGKSTKHSPAKTDAFAVNLANTHGKKHEGKTLKINMLSAKGDSAKREANQRGWISPMNHLKSKYGKLTIKT